MTEPFVVAAPRRPAPISLAAVLMIVMAAGGLIYALVVMAVTPSVVAAFRLGAAATGADVAEIDSVVTILWWVAGIGVLVGLVVAAVLTMLALGLRRGSTGARTGTWLVGALGLLCGCGTAVISVLQRSTPVDLPSGFGAALSAAYPPGWLWLNVGLAGGQMLAYILVLILLTAGSGTWFRPAPHTGMFPAPPTGYPLAGAPYPPQPFTPQPPPYGPAGAPQQLYGPPWPNTSQPPTAPPPPDDRWAPPST